MTTPPEPPQGDAWQNAPRMSPEQNAPQYGSPPPPGGPPGYGGGGGYGGPPGYGGPQQRGTSNGMGIAALVLGILGILTCWFIVGGFFGLLALIFGIIGRGKAKRGDASNGGMALAGLILGILSLLIAIFIAVVLGQFANEFGNFAECMESAQTTQEQQDCEDEFNTSINN